MQQSDVQVTLIAGLECLLSNAVVEVELEPLEPESFLPHRLVLLVCDQALSLHGVQLFQALFRRSGWSGGRFDLFDNPL